MPADLLQPEGPRAIPRALQPVLGRLAPGKRMAWGVAGTLVAAMWIYFYGYEGQWVTITFVLAVTLTLIALLILATQRVLFSTALVAGFVALIIGASEVKQHYLGMVLHAYDIVFYMLSPYTVVFLWDSFRLELIALAAALAANCGIAWLLYRSDPTRIPRLHTAAAVLIFSAIALWAGHAKGERRHLLFYWDHHYVSSFYASWAETIETLWRGQLIEAAPGGGGSKVLASPGACHPGERAPHIILIHQESIFPPSYFPEIRYDRRIDPFFRSFDGKVHKLRVETFGGASWLTEFSVLAGVSTYSFGGMRTFVQTMMRDRVRDTVPEALARCGYRNVMFYPVPKSFVSSGRFYAAIGFSEIFDFKAQGAKTYNERDRFYYNNALADMAQHLAKAQGPLFSFIITSATHLPYRPTYMPEVEVPGGGPGTTPEIHEYLRRVGMARIDYDYFRAELERRFPDERFLIVQYGDHQPIVTRKLLGFGDVNDAEDMALTPESRGFLTYYSIDGVNYEPPPLPEVDALDVPYLGSLMLHAAGLPLSDSHRERLRLLGVCEGRYFTCRRRDQILTFHRNLIQSGLMDAR